MSDRDILHQRLICLGDMMGDGLHLERDGRWIAREYKRVLKALYPEMFPKRNTTERDTTIAEWCKCNPCNECGGEFKQTRKGSMRVVCTGCGVKRQLKVKKHSNLQRNGEN